MVLNKKIKQKHGSLTSNDLRLCAYLRLNLSSKEIAPLLNISATDIRDSIKDQKTIRYLVPENVRKEIEDHHYYK